VVSEEWVWGYGVVLGLGWWCTLVLGWLTASHISFSHHQKLTILVVKWAQELVPNKIRETKQASLNLEARPTNEELDGGAPPASSHEASDRLLTVASLKLFFRRQYPTPPPVCVCVCV
jgi:hypothetical protein